jgi:diadenylate cyclase
VVSEETGGISICIDGSLQRNLTEKQFRERIAEIFLSPKPTNENQSSEKLDREDSVTTSGDSDLVSD